MTRRILFLGTLLTAFLATAQVARAQDPVYWFSEADGGLLDLETGLVWGFDVTANAPPYSLFTYDGARDLAGLHYSDSTWSYGYTDWRPPTKDELVDAFAKGMPDELDYWAAEVGAQPLYPGAHWSLTDAGKKVRGGFDTAWYGDFNTWTVKTATHGSIMYGIVVRGVPAPEEAPKPGKGPH